KSIGAITAAARDNSARSLKTSKPPKMALAARPPPATREKIRPLLAPSSAWARHTAAASITVAASPEITAMTLAQAVTTAFPLPQDIPAPRSPTGFEIPPSYEQGVTRVRSRPEAYAREPHSGHSVASMGIAA